MFKGTYTAAGNRLCSQGIQMDKDDKVQVPKWNNGWGVRHTQILLYFMCLSVTYTLRLNLTLAVVAMTTSTYKTVPMTTGEKSLVLSSLFWGYGTMQTFLGNLGRKTNSVRVLSFCLLISAILSLATPLAAIHFGAVGIIVVRVLMGTVQGGIYPNTNNLMSTWVVPNEKPVLIPIVYNGMAFGTFVAMTSSGYLAAKFNWPSIFYSTGVYGILAGIILLYFGKCSPYDHKGISKEELEFMRNSFGDNGVEKMRTLSVPWKKIFTSGPMIALAVTQFCNSWGFWTMNTLTPTYLNGVLHFDVESDGFLSALPPLTSLILSFLFTFISKKIRDFMPPLYMKYMWNSIGMYGSATALIILAYTQDQTFAIALITAGNGIIVAGNLGFQTNHIDLSPNFAGVLYSITNTIGNFASIFGPLISTYMVKDTSDLYQWRIVFLLASAILVIGNTCFLFWGTTKKQEWNEGATEKPQVI